MKKFTLYIFIILVGCSKPDLHYSTADLIMNHVKSNKGNNAVLLNFWATWCKPCVEEFPMITELAGIYDKDLTVYFISVDWLEEEEKVLAFLKKQGVEWTTFIKQQDDQAFINNIHLEWSGAVPFTILYGKTSGEVVDYWVGEQPESRFINAINKAIKL